MSASGPVADAATLWPPPAPTTTDCAGGDFIDGVVVVVVAAAAAAAAGGGGGLPLAASECRKAETSRAYSCSCSRTRPDGVAALRTTTGLWPKDSNGAAAVPATGRCWRAAGTAIALLQECTKPWVPQVGRPSSSSWPPLDLVWNGNSFVLFPHFVIIYLLWENRFVMQFRKRINLLETSVLRDHDTVFLFIMLKKSIIQFGQGNHGRGEEGAIPHHQQHL